MTLRAGFRIIYNGLVAGLLLTGCNTDSEPSPLSAAVRVDRCTTSCVVTVIGVDSVSRGDSILIGQFVLDSSGTVDSVTERDFCALGAVFLLGADTALTVPLAVTCPGQVIRRRLGHPLGGSVGFDGRFDKVIIPVGLAPGGYRVRGLFLEERVPQPEIPLRVF